MSKVDSVKIERSKTITAKDDNSPTAEPSVPLRNRANTSPSHIDAKTKAEHEHMIKRASVPTTPRRNIHRDVVTSNEPPMIICKDSPRIVIVLDTPPTDKSPMIISSPSPKSDILGSTPARNFSPLIASSRTLDTIISVDTAPAANSRADTTTLGTHDTPSTTQEHRDRTVEEDNNMEFLLHDCTVEEDDDYISTP